MLTELTESLEHERYEYQQSPSNHRSGFYERIITLKVIEEVYSQSSERKSGATEHGFFIVAAGMRKVRQKTLD